MARNLPALTRAAKLQARAARVGFDWPDFRGVLAKVQEELTEVEAELTAGADAERTQAEIGDLLFAAVDAAGTTLLAVTHDHELLPRFDRTVDFNTFLGQGAA